MSTNVRFLTVEDVLEIHAGAIAERRLDKDGLTAVIRELLTPRASLKR